MSELRTVEFLRRRYAAAILRDDAATAGRLRAQLDGVMNHRAGATRRDESPPPEVSLRVLEVRAGPQPSPGRLAGSGPRLCLVPAVTGLLEGPRPGRRGSIGASPDRNGGGPGEPALACREMEM
jgi:hypothetical protein